MSEKNELSTLTQNNASEIMKELEDAFFDIPFGHSNFQVKHFVFGSNLTPERAYKSLGIELMEGIKQLKNSVFQNELAKIEYEELQHKYETEENPFEKRKLEIKIKQADQNDWGNRKWLNDKLIEVNNLYTEFKKYPKFTREQFEEGEKRYFLESLNRQANGITGAKEALNNLHDDYIALSSFGDNFQKLQKKDINPEEIGKLYDTTMKNLKTNELYLRLENENKKLENKE